MADRICWNCGSVIDPAGSRASSRTDASLAARAYTRVTEHKTGKNRLHLDLFSDNVPDEVARLRELGANLVEEKQDFEDEWTVMADPKETSSASDGCPGRIPRVGRRRPSSPGRSVRPNRSR